MSLIKNKTYLYFIIYFIFYGAIIALITSFVSYKLQFANIEEKIDTNAKLSANEKIANIKNHIQDIERNLQAISKNFRAT